MLSVTVLPAELHSCPAYRTCMVFSVVYPAIGALLPVAVFGLARRVLSRRWAFAAATFVIVQEFQELPALARQEIAMVLFAALLAAMLDARIEWCPRWALVALLGLAMVVSHYSTTYVAITLTGLMLALQWILSWFREIPRVTGAVAVAFIAALSGALIWYRPATNYSSSPEPLFSYNHKRGDLTCFPTWQTDKACSPPTCRANTAPPISAERVRPTRPRLLRVVHGPGITPLPDASLRNTRFATSRRPLR